MVAAISSAQDGNRKALALWASYLGGMQAQKQSVRTVKLETLETAVMPKAAVLKIDTGTLHSSGCKCTMCSPADLSMSGAGTSGGKIFKIKLSGQLSEEEQKIVQHLRKRDAQVRAHEQAHLVAAGPYALGGPKYTYQVGPDGQRYAVGGEVQVDLSEEADPGETLRKAQVLQRAALAPSDPSSADRQVAMLASRMAREALQDLSEQARDNKPRADPHSSDPTVTSVENSEQRPDRLIERVSDASVANRAADENRFAPGSRSPARQPTASSAQAVALTHARHDAQSSVRPPSFGLDLYI